MTDSDNIQAAAKAIRQARQDRCPTEPVSTTYGITTAEQAYRIAQINHPFQRQALGRVTGKKVGLTAAAVQKQLGISEPDYGLLFAGMEHLDHDDVPFDEFIAPKVEAEVAFIMDRDLKAEPPSFAEFVASVAYTLPAIEIVDSVVKEWQISLVDTVADNSSAARYVLGNQPVRLGTIELQKIDMQLWVNHSVAVVGSATVCMGNPLRAAYWLACTMSEHGQPLRAGEVILSGSLGPMKSVEKGDVVHAQLGKLGFVNCQFV